MQTDISRGTPYLRISEYGWVESLALQLKPVLSAILQQVRTQFNSLLSPGENNTVSKQALEAYNAWQAHSNGTFTNPQEDFCLQTAYLQFVRTFFIRVCQDHGLISCPITDEKLASTTLLKNTYLSLLKKLYPHICSGNQSGNQDFFDWFTPDTQSISSLFHLLRRYDFKDVRSDVLGRIHDEGFIENKGRSEKGQFYTPAHIVNYMLDTLNIPGWNDCINDYTKYHAFLEKTIADISCGSGSFLVAAAARKRLILLHLIAARKISSEYALRIMSNTLLGFDLNPFACYLAQINLVLQCLPFLIDEQGMLCRSIERLHLYCADVLEPASTEPINPSTHQRQFNYLVGNPPYVSAGESLENLRYREKVSASGIYQLLYQRWDLFVPFFERNLQLLKPGGTLGLIVSNGIETEGYAERLRQALYKNYTLLQIDFFPGLRLFQDAAVENTIVLVENHAPDEQHIVRRRRHLQADCKHFATLPPLPQLSSNGQIFRWRYDPILDKNMTEGSVPLCAIVYIGTGIEAQSDEDYDPIVNGKRQKRFTLNDVFLPPSVGKVPPTEYTDSGVLGDDVDRYYLRRKRFVAYEKFRPYMRGPRHIALFRTSEKLLLGETSGGYYDREGLFANHSVQVVVSWKALEQAGAIEEKGIQTVLRKSRQITGITNSFAPIADCFDLRYLLGIINSNFMRQYIASNMHEGTREGRIYPDIWKRLPIKVASAERQQQIAMLVDAVQSEYKRLALSTPISLENIANNQRRDIRTYIALGVLQFFGDVESTIAEKPALRDGKLILRRQPLTYLESTDPELLRYLELYLTQLHPASRGWSWMEARKRIEAPATLEAVHSFMTSVDNLNAEKQQIRTTIATLLSQIEDLVVLTYSEPPDAKMMESIYAKMAHRTEGELF